MNAATGNMTALHEAGPDDGGASGRTVLSARGLGKSFGGFHAVRNVDLDVEHARVHALIGPNGAGKTTVFNLLTKFLQPSSGEITLLGETITRARSGPGGAAWGWCARSRFRQPFRI
ncbi:ABC transporter-like protein [Brucella intermedia M86]|uniref:ABC transporter-like protein n=1 Tax=Brucella intermedia M86 TaxID=1234597 RepID=M5JKK9_9HYPH|nr:ABC transporter-like protein [Brucella intermedia M86]